jgi:hypothetical protein
MSELKKFCKMGAMTGIMLETTSAMMKIKRAKVIALTVGWGTILLSNAGIPKKKPQTAIRKTRAIRRSLARGRKLGMNSRSTAMPARIRSVRNMLVPL